MLYLIIAEEEEQTFEEEWIEPNITTIQTNCCKIID